MDMLFILTYTALSWYNGIYVEVFVKAFIILPVTLYTIYTNFVPQSIDWWRNELIREADGIHQNITPSKYYIYLISLIVMCYWLGQLLDAMGDPYAEIVVVSGVSSVCAVLLHVLHNHNKWVFWIVYNISVTYIWIKWAHNPNIILFSIFFTLASILAYVEYLLNRNDPDWLPMFSMGPKDVIARHRQKVFSKKR